MSFAGTVWARASPRHRLPAASPRIPACLGMLLFLLFAASATGQQALNDLGQASLEELGSIQVYTASKHLQSTSDAPSSVSVVTADEIQKYGYRTLADILESVRGFYITYDRD
jgi:outer membrane receptor for ferrienterochelin and colicin